MMSSGKNDPDKVKLGEHVILAGLFIQIFVFGFFVVVAMAFQIRGRDHFKTLAPEVTWRKHLNNLYITSAFILVRSVFRVVEYLQGNNGFLMKHEVFLYVFDAALMLGVVVVMNFIHPGDIARLLKEKSDRGDVVELDRPHSDERSKESGYSSESRQPYV